MELAVIDLIVAVFIILGTFIGLKKGLVREVISIIGVIIAVILAWQFKNIVSGFLYSNLPFINLTGESTLLNIIIVELIAFLAILIVLLIVLKLITSVTGLLDKIVGIASGLGTISKLLGMVVGFIESYVVVFFVLFFLTSFANLKVDDTTISKYILKDTPVLAEMVKNENETFKEIMALKDKYKEKDDKYNQEVFEIMVKYDFISKDTAKKLVENKKIKIDNADEIIKKYN